MALKQRVQRRFKRMGAAAPELLATAALIVVSATTWVINPLAGAYAAGVSLGVVAWVIALARRPGG